MELKNSVETQEEKIEQFLKNYLAFLGTQNDCWRLPKGIADVWLRRRKLEQGMMK